MGPGSGRGLTILAVGFLALDAVLLGLIGWWTHRWGLLGIGGGLLAAAWGVLLLWRRQRRRLVEIAAARAALKNEISDLRGLIRPQGGEQLSDG